ncbi:hypothetical protein ACWDUL_26610 [Nocardia niigatensis]
MPSPKFRMFTTIPDRIRRRWRATADDLLPPAYLRYQCAAIAAAHTDRTGHVGR